MVVMEAGSTPEVVAGMIIIHHHLIRDMGMDMIIIRRPVTRSPHDRIALVRQTVVLRRFEQTLDLDLLGGTSPRVLLGVQSCPQLLHRGEALVRWLRVLERTGNVQLPIIAETFRPGKGHSVTRQPSQYRLQITWNHTPLLMVYSLTHPHTMIPPLELASQVHSQLQMMIIRTRSPLLILSHAIKITGTAMNSISRILPISLNDFPQLSVLQVSVNGIQVMTSLNPDCLHASAIPHK